MASQKNISGPSGWKKIPTLIEKTGARLSRSAAQNPAHGPESRRPMRNISQVVPAKMAMNGPRSTIPLTCPVSRSMSVPSRFARGGWSK